MLRYHFFFAFPSCCIQNCPYLLINFVPSEQMNNLSLMEINIIRPFFTRAFNELRKLPLEEVGPRVGGGD